MKILIIALALMLAACDGLPTAPTNTDLVTPEHEYEIDTWGFNSEIYEFTPRGARRYNCVVFMTDEALYPAMQCMKKEAVE